MRRCGAHATIVVTMPARQISPTELRLVNWGRYNKLRGIPNLDPPSYVQIMSEYFAQDVFIEPNLADAMHLEHLISTLDMAGRNGFGDGDIHAYILRLEFIQRERPRELKVKKYQRDFKTSICDRTYRRYVHAATEMVNRWSNPLNCPKNIAIVSG